MDEQQHTPPPTENLTFPVKPFPVPGASSRPPRSARWVLPLAGVVLVVGFGAIAVWQRWFSLPFLTPNAQAVVQAVLNAIDDVDNAQYRLAFSLATEPRDASIEPLPLPESQNSSGSASDISDVASSLLPSDFAVSAGVTFYVETDKDPQDADALFSIDGTYEGGDLSIAFDAEMRKIDDAYFGIIRKAPAFPGFDVGSIKEQWIAMEANNTPTYIPDISAIPNRNETVAALKTILSAAVDSKFLTLGKHEGAETIAGKQTDHFLLNIDADALEAFLTAAKNRTDAEGRGTDGFDEMLQSIQEQSTAEMIATLIGNSTAEVWVGDDGIIRQFRWTMVVVPPETLGVTDRQYAFDVTITLDHVNEPVQIERPTDTITIDEAERLLTGISEAEQAFNKQVQRVNTLVQALKFVNDETGAYPETLELLNTQLMDITAAPCDEDELGSHCYYITRYKNGVEIEDAYTNEVFGYEAVGDDFQLRYTIHMEGIDSFFTSYYVEGTNTATNTALSVERAELDGETLTTEPAVEMDTDTDEDGLRDVDEPGFGTDPANPDTDGDGYLDGTEVQNEYNPNGEGPLVRAGEWSACIPLATYGTCNAYCESIEKSCSNYGITSRDYKNWGTEVWGSESACTSGGDAGGQFKCIQPVGDDAARWKCFCN